MPELPEVETIKQGLDRLLPGQKVIYAESDWAKSFPNALEDIKQFLLQAEILRVRRRAKVLIIDLSSGYSLVVHLKMTGQMVFRGNAERFGAGHPSGSLIGDLPDKSTRVIIGFADGGQLFFNDQRKFGWMRLIPTMEIVNLDFFRKVGPEPLSDDFSGKVLMERIKRRKNSSIKAVLLDQTIVAGIGNIYADESLWGAKLHPATLVSSIKPRQADRLYQEIVTVLKLSIEKGGSTDKNYIDAEGKRGSYLSFAKVFRREGQPCPRCGHIIEKIRVAGRGTHFCPVCQKRP